MLELGLITTYQQHLCVLEILRQSTNQRVDELQENDDIENSENSSHDGEDSIELNLYQEFREIPSEIENLLYEVKKIGNSMFKNETDEYIEKKLTSNKTVKNRRSVFIKGSAPIKKKNEDESEMSSIMSLEYQEKK